MTVNHLHREIIKRKEFDQNNGTNKHALTDVIPVSKESATVGVDASVWLYRAVRNKPAAQYHHTLPEIPNEPALGLFKKRYHILEQNKLTPVFVLDGIDNPLKKGTHDDRVNSAKQAKDKLARLLKAGRPQDLERG